MPRLFVLGGRDVGESFPIRDGAVAGRHPDCDVQLRDRSVSRQHARFECAQGTWYVVDQGSRNGVRVHGKRVRRAALTDHDEILLGELPLRFRLDEEEEAVPTRPAPPARAAMPPAKAPPKPGPPPAPRHREKIRSDADDGVVLEEEIDLTQLAATREAPAPEGVRKAAPLDERELARARILREQSRRGGLLTGDLTQRPLWVRAVVILFVLAFAAALAWGAFAGVRMLRGEL